MNEMIERVAKAMAAEEGDVFSDGKGIGGWIGGAPVKELWLGRARAAVEAMREPTEEMINAGYVDGTYYHEVPPAEVWQLMIAAAIARP